MSKKGGGSSGQTTTSTNAPPKEVLDNYNAVMARANTVASAPYQAYGGQRVADFNATQQAGLQGITNSQGMAQPYIDRASTLSNQSAQPLWQNIPQYNSENIAKYQSPYTQNVVDTTMANIHRNDAVQQQGLLGHAISSGASPFGGDRAGVAAAELARNQNLASGQTIAGLENQGFQNAQQQFNQQQQLQLTGQNADAARQAQAAQLQGNLGLASQGAALQGATAQLQAGTMQQQNTQAGLDAAYQQFQEQQAFPYQQTQWLGNLALGLGSNSGGTSATTQPTPPSMFSSLGPGLFNGFKDGGSIPHRAMGGGFGNSWIPDDDMMLGSTMPQSPQMGKQSDPNAQLMQMAQLAMMFAKDGGRINRAEGGLVPHLATGGTPYGNISWIPEGDFKAGHSMPSAPQVQKPQSSGLNPAQMISMGSSLFGGKAGGASDVPVVDMSTYNNGGSYESNYGGGKNGGDWAGLLGNDGSDGWLSNAMGMAAMFRNGGRIKRDDGGFIPDDSDEVSIDTPSEGFGTMPETPAPEAGVEDITAENNPGLSIANSNPQVETKKPDLGRALIVGGLTALAGKDFDPGRNLANGALAGFSNYSGQENAIAKAQASAQKEKALEAHQSNMDSKPQMVNTGKTLQWFYPQEKDPKTGKKGLMVDTGIPTAAWATEQANAPLKAAQVDYYKKRSEDGKFSAIAGMGQDENGQSVQGTYVFDAKTGESTFKPGMVTTGKGNKTPAITPPDMSPEVFKKNAANDSKRVQAYNSNKPVIENAMAALDTIEPNLNNFQTGSGGDTRGSLNRAIAMGANTPVIGSLIPNSAAKSADVKGTAAANIDKATNDLVMELQKFQPAPGARGSVLALKTMLASKPGVNQPLQTNQNIISGLRAKLMDYDLSEDLATQYRETSPYKISDSKSDQLDRALKTMYPIKSVDPKTGQVAYHPENVEKIRQAIPDAIQNPEKYLGGQPVNTPQQVAPVAQTGASVPPPQQREAGKVYATPKGNLTWTGTGWVQ